MDMIIKIYLGLLISLVLFFVVGGYIEKNFDESHRVKKWWRKHLVGLDPERKTPNDDINK
jgi:hypothetical protein